MAPLCRDTDSRVLEMKNNPCYYSRCKTTVFKEKCLASKPFVKEHVDVNVHLPQMFTELLLNKLFVPYLFSVMVRVFFLDSLPLFSFFCLKSRTPKFKKKRTKNFKC